MAEDIIVPTEEELNDNAVLEFYQAFKSSFDKNNSPFGDYLYDELRKGKKEIYNKSVRETKLFDGSFLNVLKSAYSSISKICFDPRRTLKYEQEVVNVERAKKLNGDSVRHLAQNTQFIKNVDTSGFVTPSKVLTSYSDDNIAIYENIFIKTLVNRVVRFLKDRVDLLKENCASYQSDVIKYRNSAKVNKTVLEIEMKVRVANEIESDVKKVTKFIDDVENVLKQYTTLKATPLYEELYKKPDVKPPIMKTNIILHNSDFKVAYNLWTYLERNTEMDFDVDAKERAHQDNENVSADLDKIGTVLLAQILSKRGIDGYDFKTPQAYRRRQISKLEVDDETEYKLNPDKVKFTSNEIAEFFLAKTSDYFEGKMNEELEKGLKYESSIKSVFKEILNIVNMIYPALFGQPEINVEGKSANEIKLAEIKHQLKMINLVYHQKVLDLKKTERQIVKNENLIEKLNDRIERDKEKNSLRREQGVYRLNKETNKLERIDTKAKKNAKKN